MPWGSFCFHFRSQQICCTLCIAKWSLSRELVLQVSQIFFIKIFLQEKAAIILGCSGPVVMLAEDLVPAFFRVWEEGNVLIAINK